MSKQHTSSYTVQEEAQLTKHQDILLLSRLGQYIKTAFLPAFVGSAVFIDCHGPRLTAPAFDENRNRYGFSATRHRHYYRVCRYLLYDDMLQYYCFVCTKLYITKIRSKHYFLKFEI